MCASTLKGLMQPDGAQAAATNILGQILYTWDRSIHTSTLGQRLETNLHTCTMTCTAGVLPMLWSTVRPTCKCFALSSWDQQSINRCEAMHALRRSQCSFIRPQQPCTLGSVSCIQGLIQKLQDIGEAGHWPSQRGGYAPGYAPGGGPAGMGAFAGMCAPHRRHR